MYYILSGDLGTTSLLCGLYTLMMVIILLSRNISTPRYPPHVLSVLLSISFDGKVLYVNTKSSCTGIMKIRSALMCVSSHFCLTAPGLSSWKQHTNILRVKILRELTYVSANLIFQAIQFNRLLGAIGWLYGHFQGLQVEAADARGGTQSSFPGALVGEASVAASRTASTNA